MAMRERKYVLMEKGQDEVFDSSHERHDHEVEPGWVRVCAVVDLMPGEAAVAPTIPPIAVFNVDGELLATDDTCTHAESSLADGFIEGDTVECEMHFAKFCIRTGAALTRPAVIPLQTYPVRVSDGQVFVSTTPLGKEKGQD